MTTKEKVINESLKRVSSEIGKIDEILNATPLNDIIKLEKEAIETAKKMVAGSREVLEYLNNKQKEKDELLILAEKQKNSSLLIDRKVNLEREKADLINELYFLRR